MATIGLDLFSRRPGPDCCAAPSRIRSTSACRRSRSCSNRVGVGIGQRVRLWSLRRSRPLVAALALFFQQTATGRALRAVADDHQAAQSVGIPLRTIWVIVWSVAGFVGARRRHHVGLQLGVQFSLSLIALKALPVLILGGFTSMPGAIVGGLDHRRRREARRDLSRALRSGGGIEVWFAYVLALVFLLFRPQGLFGERIIDRV